MRELPDDRLAGLNLVRVGVLVCDPESLAVRFANEQARRWFGAEAAGRALDELITSVDRQTLRDRLAKGRTFSRTGEVEPPGERKVPYRISVRTETVGSERVLLAEVENISKLKEQEYLLESYSKMIEHKNRELVREKERSDRLLMNIFPPSVLKEFQEFGATTPKFFEEVSVLYVDFVDFTKMPVSRQPKLLIAELNDIFSTFDLITEHHNGERIKTIGDAYLAVSGMPTPNPDHAEHVVTAARKMLRYLRRRNDDHDIQWICRIGVHTGSVVGSVVGVRKYIYDVFGDGINMASRMESLSEPMRITISERTHELVKERITCTDRGMIDVKGTGPMRLYFVDD